MAPKSSNFSKEEELLLQDFGRDLSRKSSVIFYVHALFVSAIPLWLFNRIHQMEMLDNAILFVIGTIFSAYFVALAYKNNKFELKHKIAQKRSDGVAAELNAKMSETESKKISKKEKDERILWRKNEIAEAESMQLAVFYTNSLFLILLILSSFFFFKSYSPMPNYIISMVGASSITGLLSTSSQK
ncbi:translocon-associated protein subunit gamma-like [Ciona intestinalis]